MQRIAAEILLSQLSGKNSEDEVKDVLRQAFFSVEKGYYESIDSLIAEKIALQSQLSKSPNQREAILKKLEDINRELSVGCSVALCLIYNSKLYICNLGTCRVILCKNDENKVPRAIQFSADHNIYNEDELLRLKQIGLDIAKLEYFPIESTRCLGYFVGKGGFKNSEIFKMAAEEPIIAQPEIAQVIPIDESFQFLLLISSGMSSALRDIYGGDVAMENKEIVRITAKEFETQSTLANITQSIVNTLVNLHRDMFEEKNFSGRKREEFTLLLRRFSNSNLNLRKRNQVTFNTCSEEVNNSEITTCTDTNRVSCNTTFETDTSTTISSLDQKHKEIFDKNRKIMPYVDFRSFYENVEEARKQGKLPPDIEFV